MADKNKDGNLKVVPCWDKTAMEWEKEEKELRISEREARQRVRVLRDELEAYRQQMEGVPFDIPAGHACSPMCLANTARRHTLELVESLDPRVNGLFEMIDDYASKHGCYEHLDFEAKLFAMKLATAETTFKIGVLAGAIFAGCSREQVDRFERGLVVSLTSDNRLVK